MQRDLWDYAGERLAEGPLEQVEQHLETCAVCRKEVSEWRRAQRLLTTAQNAPLPPARLGWNDLQARIAADVTAFGPPRPDKTSTRQAVSQLIRPRRAHALSGMSALRPVLVGGMAFALAFVLFPHRAPQTAPGFALPAPSAPVAPPPATPAVESNLATLAEVFPSALSLTEAPTKEAPAAQSGAVKTAAAPQTTKENPTEKPTVKTPTRPTKAATQKIALKVPASKSLLANTPQSTKDDNKIKFTPRDSAATEKAPDASEVAQGVIGTLTPVSHEENNVY